jgi:hypothetical protein
MQVDARKVCSLLPIILLEMEKNFHPTMFRYSNRDWGSDFRSPRYHSCITTGLSLEAGQIDHLLARAGPATFPKIKIYIFSFLDTD